MSPKSGLPDYDPRETRSPQPFIELMALERLDDGPENVHGPEKIEHFSSLASPFPPGETTMAFGGHVCAQSAYAASQTVESGFVINVSVRNITPKQIFRYPLPAVLAVKFHTTYTVNRA